MKVEIEEIKAELVKDKEEAEGREKTLSAEVEKCQSFMLSISEKYFLLKIDEDSSQHVKECV